MKICRYIRTYVCVCMYKRKDKNLSYRTKFRTQWFLGNANVKTKLANLKQFLRLTKITNEFKHIKFLTHIFTFMCVPTAHTYIYTEWR